MADTNAGDPRIGVTNNERSGTRHLVQPYAEAPVVNKQAKGTCAFCGHAGFRRSRVRLTDIPRLLLFKYPVRCTRCGQRQFVSVGTALAAQRTKTHSLDPSPDAPGSWKSFTAGRSTRVLSGQPASAAKGPAGRRAGEAFEEKAHAPYRRRAGDVPAPSSLPVQVTAGEQPLEAAERPMLHRDDTTNR